MPYIDIHNERVWIPERPLRSMDEARPMRDGDLWRCPACGRELDEEENDDGTITLVCPAHQVGWDAGHEDEPYPMGGLVFRLTMGGGVFIVPILTLVFHVPFATAIGAGLCSLQKKPEA